MNKDTYDLTPVPQKDIFTYTNMTENEFEDLVVNLFDKHAKKIGDYWVNEDALDACTVHDFARDLRAVLAAANGPLQATISKPLPVIPWSGSNLTEMEELLQKVQQLERENATLRADKERLHRLAYDMAAEMEHHGGEQAFDSAARYWAARAKEGQP